MSTRTIGNDVLTVLSAGRCDGNRYFLPAHQLDRKMYVAVNDVLAALGGKWNRSSKAHLFAEPCEEIVDAAIESGTYTKPSDMGWFPTPAELAERVVAMADVRPAMLALEPSAGEGSLAAHMMRREAIVHCFEIDEKRAAKIEAHEVRVGDFLQIPPEPKYDRVVMNPPFAKRADIHHVNHARKFLKPGGKLVSIMSAGVAFREDALASAFRDQCESIEPLPDGSFHESGTDVRTVVVTMRAA